MGVLLACGACARTAPASTPLRPAPARAVGDGSARLAPALDALHARPADLARRPPRLRQCVENLDTAAYRAAPLELAAWPPPSAHELWGMGDPDRVVAWALRQEPVSPAPPAADLDEAIARWSHAAAGARARFRKALRRTTSAEGHALADAERIGPPPATATRAERDAAAAADAERRRLYCRVAQAVPLPAVTGALAELWQATRELEAAVRRLPPEAWPTDGPRRSRTADGFVIVVGTPGDDTVDTPWHLWVDRGGNDEVTAGAPVAFGGVQASVDLAGDDHYAAAGGGVAGGVGVLSVLIDAGGDDAYDGARWSVGAAAFGGALLLDRSGDDAYAVRSAGIGAAFHGVGLLLDGAGVDVYTVGVQGEAFAGPGGFALLWDGAGDDTYTAGGVAPDRDRDPRFSLSMAQGCGFGLRPDAEGGTALLVDVRGNDRYQGEIFAQGVGYWGGAGFLWDGAGDDTYVTVQYGQGTGLHFGLGVLSDGAGDDIYVAGGLAQGCGHDLGIGVCTNAGGNDRYSGAGLAAGAASAGGLGLFWDGAGADRYNLNPLTNLGCDASTDDRPGFALHVDAGGRDQFGLPGAQADTSAPARDGTTWFTGRAGVAVNRAPEE